MINSKRLSKMLERIGQDLRKASYLIGIGLVGMIISNDSISILEGFSLFLLGIYAWISGHYCIYCSEKFTDEHNKED